MSDVRDPTRTAATGDDTGATITYACLSGDRLVSAPDLRGLLRAAGKVELELDPIALSHLLHDGFVPFPRTIFKDVYALGIGDRAVLVERGGRPGPGDVDDLDRRRLRAAVCDASGSAAVAF